MTKKDEAPLRPGDFQIDPKDPRLDTGNFVANGIIKGLVEWGNKLDSNKDHIRDIAQLAPIIIKLIPVFVKMLPILKEFLPMVNAEGFKAWVMSHAKDFFTVEKSVIESKLLELEPHIMAVQAAGTEVAKLAPTK